MRLLIASTLGIAMAIVGAFVQSQGIISPPAFYLLGFVSGMTCGAVIFIK